MHSMIHVGVGTGVGVETETPAADPKSGHRAEEDFVDRFAAELEAGSKGVDRGLPRDSKAAGTQPTVIINEEQEEESEIVDDDQEEEAEPAKPVDKTENTVDEEEDVEGEGEETAAEEKARIAAEKAVEDEFTSVLTKHGLKTTLEELPEAARPLVKRRLDEQSAAFTRAMQDARSYRGEEAKFRAEQKFAAEHPDLFVMELLQKDPALFDKINDLLGEVSTETGKKALEVITKDTRREVLDAVTKAANDAKEQDDRRMSRADEMVVYTRKVAQRLDVPERFMMKAVAFELRGKPEDSRDLTNDELEKVLRGAFSEYRAIAGKARTEKEKENIRARTKDRQTTSPVARSRTSGTPAAPSGSKPPKTDDEFAEHMARKFANR